MSSIAIANRVPFTGSVAASHFKKVLRNESSSPLRFSKSSFKRQVQKFSTLSQKIETAFSKTPNLLKSFKEKNLRNSAEEAINKFIMGGLEKEDKDMIIQGFRRLKKIDGRMPENMNIKKEIVRKADFISKCFISKNKNIISSKGPYREQLKYISEMDKGTGVIINEFLEKASNYCQRTINSDIERARTLVSKAQQKIDSKFVFDRKFISRKISERKKNGEQYKETTKLLNSLEKYMKSTLSVKNKEMEKIKISTSALNKEYNEESAQENLLHLRDNLNWVAKTAREIIDLDPDGLLFYSDLTALPIADLQALSGKVGEMYRELDQATWDQK